MTRDFLSTLYGSGRSAARGGPLKEAFDAAGRSCDPKFSELRDLRALHAVQRLARL